MATNKTYVEVPDIRETNPSIKVNTAIREFHEQYRDIIKERQERSKELRELLKYKPVIQGENLEERRKKEREIEKRKKEIELILKDSESIAKRRIDDFLEEMDSYYKNVIDTSARKQLQFTVIDIEENGIEDHLVALPKQSANDSLAPRQVRDLEDINKSLEVDAKDSLKQLKERKRYKIGVGLLLLFVVVTIMAVRLYTGISQELVVINTMIPSNESYSSLNVSMDNKTNKLVYNVDKVAINSNNNEYLNLSNLAWLRLDIDTNSEQYEIDGKTYALSKKTFLKTFDIKQDSVYLQYSNNESTALKELIISKEVPSIDTKSLQTQGRFKESANPIKIRTTANSFNDSFIMVVEALAGGSLSIESLKPQIRIIESQMSKSVDTEGIKVNLEELGTLNLDSFDELKTSPELIYNEDDGVLRLRNSSENIDYIYISSIDNETIGCMSNDLLATTNDKLFVHIDYDDIDSIGYKTFALKTDTNLYVFKLNKLAHDSLQKELFNQLGIDVDKVEIKTIQTVIINDK